MSAFGLSFCAGLGVLWLFSWDQFNLKTWKAGSRYGLILTVLNPADLRGAGPLARAFLVYAIIMTVIYVFVVMLVTAGVLIWEGPPPAITAEAVGGGELPAAEAPAAPAPGFETRIEAAPDPAPPVDPQPWVPLAISLAMIGLGPRFPLLQKVEEKLRRLAHKFMGVPTLLELGSEDIARAKLSLDEIGEVTQDRRQQVQGYLDAAERVLGDGPQVQRLEDLLHKIFAFRIWVVESRRWPPQIVRDRYEVIEVEAVKLMDDLIGDLDDLSGRSGREGQRAAPSATLIRRWESRINEADAVCDRICALMFVYYEKARELRSGQSGDRAADFISRALEARRSGRANLDILLALTLGITGVALLWGYAAASVQVRLDPAAGVVPSRNALLFAMSAFLIYGPAMLAAMAWQSISDDDEPDGSRVFPTARLVLIFLVSFVVALVSLGALNVGQAVVATSLEKVRENLPEVLRYAVTLEAPRAVLGGVQGVFVALYFRMSPTQLQGWGPARLCALHALALALASGFATELAMNAQASLAVLLKAAALSGLIGLMTGALLTSMLRSASAGERRAAAARGAAA
jgi:hypothetical protein